MNSVSIYISIQGMFYEQCAIKCIQTPESFYINKSKAILYTGKTYIFSTKALAISYFKLVS